MKVGCTKKYNTGLKQRNLRFSREKRNKLLRHVKEIKRASRKKNRRF